MTISRNHRLHIFTATLGLSLAVATSSFLVPTAFASGAGVGHSHSKRPFTKEEILKSSEEVRDKLIKDGKIDPTWKTIKPSDAIEKEFKKGKEWVVTFKNPAATDKSKESLYLFYALNGNFLASNYTGN
jgi:hypothetical protein